MPTLILGALGRVSSFMRREILSVFIPGLMTMLGISLCLSFEGTGEGDLSDVLDRLADNVLPASTFARAMLAILVLYGAYVLGYTFRLIAVRVVLGHRRSRSYIENSCWARKSLIETFGSDPVDEVFERHHLAELFTSRLEQQKELRPPLGQLLSAQLKRPVQLVRSVIRG